MLRVIHRFHEQLSAKVDESTDIDRATSLRVLADIARMRAWPPDEAEACGRDLIARIDEEVGSL
jgi:hypothetical protein